MYTYSDTLNFDLRKNSFNFIRLALAFLVLVAHSWELGGFGHDAIYYFSGKVYSIGSIAVDCFFSVSGILITASYKNINSLGIFIWHRILRIFPAFWLCIVLTAIILPIIFGKSIYFEYALHNLLNPAVYAFQAAIGLLVPILVGWTFNLSSIADKIPIFGQGNIPGILSDEPVNGSLWTLAHEIRLYCLIALLGAMHCLKKSILFFLFLMSWIAYSYFLIKNPSFDGLAISSPFRTTAHFLAGAFFYFCTPTIRHSWAALALIAAIFALGAGYYPLVSPFTTTYLIVYLASAIPIYNFGAKNDFSYGLYIYAFPIQKTLTALSLNNLGLPIYILLSLLFSMLFAVLSWYSIEKYSLKLKNFKLSLRVTTSPPKKR